MAYAQVCLYAGSIAQIRLVWHWSFCARWLGATLTTARKYAEIVHAKIISQLIVGLTRQNNVAADHRGQSDLRASLFDDSHKLNKRHISFFKVYNRSINFDNRLFAFYWTGPTLSYKSCMSYRVHLWGHVHQGLYPTCLFIFDTDEPVVMLTLEPTDRCSHYYQHFKSFGISKDGDRTHNVPVYKPTLSLLSFVDW